MLETALFCNLIKKEQIKLAEETSIHHYPKNSLIFEEGNKCSGLYYIEKGTIKRYVLGMNKRESIFDVCGPGEIFGHRILFNNDYHFDSSCSITDVKLHFIPKSIFLDLMDKNKDMTSAYINTLCQDSIKHIRHSQIIAQLNLKQRTAFYLLYLQSKNIDRTNMDIEISRTDLANLLGTVQESAVRTLHEFKTANALLSTGRKMIIQDYNYFRQIVEPIPETNSFTM
jgi:CRP-like cAMP-binding protein